VGTFLEGETVLILGGFAAHRDYLELPWVIVCAFIGTVAGDQLFFHLGRRQGRDAIDRRPKWKARAERILPMLEKHQVWLMIGYRYIYGIRSVTPFLLGASRVPPLRFLLFDVVGVAIWASVIGGAGYVFGEAVEVFLGDLKRFELWLFAALAAVGSSIWLYRHRSRARSRAERSPGPGE
jgi:membrane protein DedA with SNARE-associated domain